MADGVVQHKVGELLVAAPLFLILLLASRWTPERACALAERTRLVMLAGGLLNGLAWYSLRGRLAWDSFFRMWCLLLLFVGPFGSWIAKRLVSLSNSARG